MENKINIAELLKECPQGMELDCTIFNDVVFEKVDSEYSDSWIVLRRLKSNSTFYVSIYGHYYNTKDAKCVIFPKGKTTWEGFVPPIEFKEGDIIYTLLEGDLEFISIFEKANKTLIYTYVALSSTLYRGNINGLCKKTDIVLQRLATEEEKQKLFDAIKDNGYRWNAEKKTLEELIKPIFKKGDKIVKKNDVYAPIQIAYVDDGFYYFNTENSTGMLPISDQDSYELVLDKFDISTLKPFDKVLVRHDRDNTWCGSLLSHMDNKSSSYCYKFVTTAGKSYPMCIPYEGNEHLLGTANDCDSYFKTWE